MKHSLQESDFHRLDSTDPLRKFRDRFAITDPSIIYLDGNSLGRLPKATVGILDRSVRKEWGSDLIESWNKSWYGKSQEIGDTIAKIIGAQPGEVIISDNTSTNLYKLASAALRYKSERNTILTDEFNFPSDVYIFQGLIRQHERELRLRYIRSKDGISISEQEIEQKLDDQVALVSLSHVAFKSAYLYDMEKVTKMAHDHGSLVLWDLSHSVGAVPINVGTAGVDLAVGCTYKYINGGPGAPAFLYVRKDLQDQLTSPVWGWFGAESPFDFGLDYTPGSGIRRFLTGTPPILSVAAIKPGADLLLEAGMAAIRKKSVNMSELFTQHVMDRLSSFGFTLASPLSQAHRGSHISIQHDQAGKIIKALLDPSIDGHRIVPDFRAPDLIRFGFAPLYNTYAELGLTIEKLIAIAEGNLFMRYDDAMPEVT